MAPGFSKTLRERYNKKWSKMKGNGYGSLLNKRRSVVDVVEVPTKPSNFPLKKRKKSRKKSHKQKRK